MKRYPYRGGVYTIAQLSEMCGIPCHTLRDRIRRGYGIDEAVKVSPTRESISAFCEASCWQDWVDTSTDDVYQIYWKWCKRNNYTASPKQGFTRQLMEMYPQLKVVPIKKLDGYYRMIRMRG